MALTILIRLAMIALAIPGQLTFMDFNNRNWNCDPATNNITLILIGHNRNDYAVAKLFMGRRSANIVGATTLASNFNDECEKTRATLTSLGYPASIMDFVDFNIIKDATIEEEHGLYYYLQNPNMKEFLSKAFK